MYQISQGWRLMAWTVLGLLCMSNTQPGGRVFMERLGEAPTRISSYKAEGAFHDGDTFLVSVSFLKGRWIVDIRLSRGRAVTVELRADRYSSVVPQLTDIRRPIGRQGTLTVLVPFGAQKTECFANGDVVRERVIINLQSGYPPEVGELRFDGCTASFPSLSLMREGRRYIVDGSLGPDED